MIGIVDIGNATSVKNALDYLKVASIKTIDEAKLKECDALILPGVGEFGTVMNQLQKLVPLLKAWERPLLGICAGMQVLFESSEESPGIRGLGVLRGTVRRFERVRTPQIGWNRLTNIRGTIIPNEGYAYFVNSYYCVPKETITTSTARYGTLFCASVQTRNLYGVQFHPEKSGDYGLEMLETFARLCA